MLNFNFYYRGVCQSTSKIITSSHVKGTMSVLKSSAYCFSPSLGLLASNFPNFFKNILKCDSLMDKNIDMGFGSAHALGHTFFSFKYISQEISVIKTKSSALSHLTPYHLGHILGLILSNASNSQIRSTLKSIGIETNKVNGIKTGVSLQRYLTFIDEITKYNLSNSTEPNINLLFLYSRLVWEKCTTKECLLNYLCALNCYQDIFVDLSMAESGSWAQR